jgi:predicted RNase H-like nuclease
MTTLLVGFDSAWALNNRGALVGALHFDDGTSHGLGAPQKVDYRDAEDVILKWQADHAPRDTIVLLDQPTIVPNPRDSRPVEKIVGSLVSRRRGGMQPANTSKEKMFGEEAPVRQFLTLFGGPADPLEPVAGTRVFETYPVLAIIALGWMRPDGNLPKYNPKRKTFLPEDWKLVCDRTSGALRDRGLMDIVRWIASAAQKNPTSKGDQDGLDACLCLLVALYLAERKDCLMVGDLQTGYIVVPYGNGIRELNARCKKIDYVPSKWVRKFKWILPV